MYTMALQESYSYVSAPPTSNSPPWSTEITTSPQERATTFKAHRAPKKVKNSAEQSPQATNVQNMLQMT
jgi:hypothetical protein